MTSGSGNAAHGGNAAGAGNDRGPGVVEQPDDNNTHSIATKSMTHAAFIVGRMIGEPARLAKLRGATMETEMALNNFAILVRGANCEMRRGFSNFYRVNFQPHHADVNASVRIRRMFGHVTDRRSIV